MVDHTTLQLALRAKLLTLVAATTGVTTLSATATGFARAAGSFVTDGFARGMEITSSGFPVNNVTAVITSVTATLMNVTPIVITNNADGSQTVTHPAMVVESAGAGRSIVAGLPSLRAWENVGLTPQAGYPYVEEQYIPGPSQLLNDTYAGLFELTPMYSPRIYVPENTGIGADGKYADAIVRLFLPGTLIPLTSGDRFIVRGDVGPFRAQRAPSATPGWSTIPITIPLMVTTVAVAA